MAIALAEGGALLGQRYLSDRGDGTAAMRRGGLVEISGDGFFAYTFSDKASVRHVLQRKDAFGDFLLDMARDRAEIEIEAPLVTSSDFSKGRRSDYMLRGVRKGKEKIMKLEGLISSL